MIVVDSLLFAALFAPELITTETLTATFYFALFVHVMSTLYIATFGRLRTATWLLLIGAWAGWEIGTFASLVRPWRQWQAWLTQWPLVGDALVASVGRWPYLALFLLALDVVVMHYADWRRRSFLHMAVFLAAVIGATVATDLAVSAMVSVPPLPPPAQEPALPALIPIWYALPVYALLRAPPSKIWGVTAMCAALLAPMIWPWMRADVLRIGRTRWAWRLLCMMLGATWISLGYLGAQPPEGLALVAARILAIFYLAYFLVLPFALRWMARRSDLVTRSTEQSP
jgi:hypothetical protein